MSEIAAVLNLITYGFAWGVLFGAIATFKLLKWFQS